MDSKDTTKPRATGDADGSLKTPLPEPSLGHQAFDVLKDVLVEEMVEENRKLGVQNDQLEPVLETLNSTVHILYLGKEVTVDLKDGERTKDGFVVPIRDVAPIPFLDLAQNNMFSIVFSDRSDKEWKLNVKLGNVVIGNPSLFSLTPGHGYVEARNTSSGCPLLTVSLSPLVSISGHLSNASSDDIADDFQNFNQNATTRLMVGLPTPVKNEGVITFTLNSVHLKVKPGMIDIALSNYDAVVNMMPEMILRRQVRDVRDTDEIFRKVLERNMVLKAANKKLLSTRKWLTNIEFHYHGGTLNLSLEDGILVKRSKDDQGAVYVDNYKSCPFNTLNEVRVDLGGIRLSRSGPPGIDINYDAGRIYIFYGSVILFGGLDFRGIDPDTYQWPKNNMPRALSDSLRGVLTLPDEIHFVFAGLILRCIHPHVAQAVEMIGLSERESTDEDADETKKIR